MTDSQQAGMSVEERLTVLEVLVEEAVWGPYLDDPEHRKAIAANLYTRLEAADRHQPFPPDVRNALLQRADALSEIDNTPGALRPAIRPLI